MTVWGEMSPYSLGHELSYLAFARFAWDPALTWEQFITDDGAPRLGGANAAELFLALTEAVDHPPRWTPLRCVACEMKRWTPPRHDSEAGRRWLTLADRIARRGFNQATQPD